MSESRKKILVKFARERRRQKTESEALLWGVLRGRRLAGLKFRREHPIEDWIADFACIEHCLCVEIDGGYHDLNGEKDLERQTSLESLGWRVLRFSESEVMSDVNAVAIAICRSLGIAPVVMGKRIDQG